MPPQHRIPARRVEGAIRRPAPEPLSPKPEWQADQLFVAPPLGAWSEADDDIEEPGGYEMRPQRRRAHRS
ncbi:hypothetical protein [Streptomyces sp. NBC_01304]|uniref:hypothetical protein n=1 Tax=Streptomyces sp. NBC_01304 TaxID=2903818 RepID=UPI002E165E93|nr:hypothetical protein OG430_48370 [Streptomyces sp. NBC_01304]